MGPHSGETALVISIFAFFLHKDQLLKGKNLPFQGFSLQQSLDFEFKKNIKKPVCPVKLLANGRDFEQLLLWSSLIQVFNVYYDNFCLNGLDKYGTA